MTSRTIVCPECGEAVPYGRLSCPACGSLLASVAGGARSGGAGPADDVDEPPLLADDDIARPAVAAGGRPYGASIGAGAYLPPPDPAVGSPEDAARRTPSVLTPVAGPVPGVPTPPTAPTVTGAAAAGTSSGLAHRLASIPGLDSGLEQAAAVGGSLVAFGLVLPWSRAVIGAAGIDSYFDTWGLAGPGHVVVLIAAIVVTIVAALPNRVPAWIRTGLPSVALGMFVLGLLWPYVIGPLGASLGSLVALIGAGILVVVGVVVVARGRHATDAPVV